MTKIKLCGLRRPEDIEAANGLLPDYVGFVFAKKSKRYISFEEADRLKKLLDPRVKAVGVFVDEDKETVARLLNKGTIDMAQLHGNEDEAYIKELRKLTDREIIRAFRIASADDALKAEKSSADYILYDSGAGTGITLDRTFLKDVKRPYFLAGGLDPENVGSAVKELHPYAVDVSSGIETDGFKDENKMKTFTEQVRKEES